MSDYDEASEADRLIGQAYEVAVRNEHIDALKARVAELEVENERWQVREQYHTSNWRDFRDVLRAVTAERDTLTARVPEIPALAPV